MISLARLASWRLRLRRLCSLSLTTVGSRSKQTRNSMETEPIEAEMDQNSVMREFVERVDCYNVGSFTEVNIEFVKLRSAQDDFQLADEYSMSEGASAIQNRYRDVVPYNKNRVKLENNADGDYINASWIEYPDVERQYIAAQAPLQSTINDFWHMIGQYNIKVVVMLCKTVENSMPMCTIFPRKCRANYGNWRSNVGND